MVEQWMHLLINTLPQQFLEMTEPEITLPIWSGGSPTIHQNSRPYDHPPKKYDLIFFFFLKYRAPMLKSKKCPFKVKHAPCVPQVINRL